MKGRIVWVFWLVVVLTALTATASYAWLAMNVSAGVRGIEVELLSDSLFLEISADPDAGYDTSVSFDRVAFYSNNANDRDDKDERLSFITYRSIPQYGAIRISAVMLTGGEYKGNGRYFKAVKSDITGVNNSYVDITDTLSLGDSLVGFFTIERDVYYTVSNTSLLNYYYEQKDSNDNVIAYVCIGKVPEGETLAGRLVWGYAKSDELDDPQVDNVINVVSLDAPPEEYCLRKTVYLRCATETMEAKNLRVSSVEIEGRNYLEDTVRIMFVAKTVRGETVTKFYSRREHEKFDGSLFESIMGDEQEVVAVDMYVFFDGSDEDAYDRGDAFTRSNVTVKFAIDDHDYN